MTDATEEQSPRTLVEAAFKIEPYYVMLVGMLPGFALVFGSMLLHIASVKAYAPGFAKVTREVGYVPALNWSFTYAILLPVLLYLMTNTIAGLVDALNRLHDCGMVRDINMVAVRDHSITESWLVGSRGRTRLILVFSAIIPVAFGATEWFLNNLLRLIYANRNAGYPDFDWGLAGVMHLSHGADWTLILRLGNALFDFVAFAAEIVLISSLMAFFISVLDLGRVIPSGKGRNELKLIPDLNSRDKRLGFEIFEEPIENLLGVALVAYLICYLVRLQGAYMANESSSSLASFVSTDIFAGIREAAANPTRAHLADALVHLFDLGEQQIRGVLAWSMSILIAVFSLSVVIITARGAALAAKFNVENAIYDGRLELTPQKKRSAEAKLKAMVIWPLGYLRVDALLFWVAIAVFTLFLYRVGLFVAGVVSFTLFARLIYRIVRPGKRSSLGTSPSREENASVHDEP